MRIATNVCIAVLLIGGCVQLSENETQQATGIAGPDAAPAVQAKIRFDLGRLDADGLQGPAGGKRSLHYEFCIPDRPDLVQTVAAIDATLEMHRGARGRIGCGDGELLCLGSTHQPDHRTVLARLAALAEVREIREAFFE